MLNSTRRTKTEAIAVTDELALPPKKVAAIRKQLLAANTRLVAIERERRELQALIAKLATQLKEGSEER
jgi:hypothetical protein